MCLRVWILLLCSECGDAAADAAAAVDLMRCGGRIGLQLSRIVVHQWRHRTGHPATGLDFVVDVERTSCAQHTHTRLGWIGLVFEVGVRRSRIDCDVGSGGRRRGGAVENTDRFIIC